ncbi:MAG: hypothetical protein CMJ78_07515 [Planctomycetaceae bacterium]|nr:hypothetical protein [Planctomycetaceae bacterium]
MKLFQFVGIVVCVLPQVTDADESTRPSLSVAALRSWTIVVSDEAAECQKYAAEEFQCFFQTATNVKLPIKQTATKRTGNLFIGPSNALKTSPLGHVMKRKYDEEELRIVVAKDNIAILGGPRGTLYGVYEFLEDYLGVRFLTAEVTHVPKVESKHAIPHVDRSYKPPFAYRFYLKTEVMKDPVFAARRRQNAASRHGPKEQQLTERLGGQATGGVFLHNNFLLHASFNDHPEYFALRHGKRTSQQPCLTHPEVRRLVTNQILSNLKGFRKGSMIPLAQNDNGNPCLCPNCSAVQREGDAAGTVQILDEASGGAEVNFLNGPPSAVIVDFVNHVADAVAKERPDLWVGTEAYAYSVMPPRKTRVRSNVKVQVATYHCSIVHSLDDPRSKVNKQFLKYLAGWRKACDHLLIWHYDMNPRDYWLPFPNMRAQPSSLRTFVKSNGRGIFMQGAPHNTEFSDLRAYVMTALIWDPSQDADKLINEFLSLYYGRAAKPIRQWIDLFHEQAIASGSESNINATARSYGLDAKLGERGVKLFEQALQLADNETIRHRVEKVSVTGWRLALDPVWWNAIEAPRRARILKTTVEKERVEIAASNLPRYRKMATKLFEIADRHKLGGPRQTVSSYLQLPQEPQKDTKK